ncbi:AEC family transporter [Geomonas sp. Red32]|uniref:AEC family transporter n=1 Tax=Geomonas sp. Red32 TaxID=2912856 RepID=UPI00202CDCDD|nr:AEC family transporter [Geomonas sp. Red32]MCM0080047.1 AEC family transporter [Geomonas sp. Red32]
MPIISPETLMVVRAVLPSFTIALLGVLLGKMDRRRELNQKTISNMVYYFFTPCLVFSSLHKRSFDFVEFALIGGAAFLLIAVMTPIAFFFKRRAGVRENGYCLPIIFMNTGNISLPIALLLFGNDGLAKAILFHMMNILVLYSYGVYLVSGQTDLRQFLKIPALYATLLGVLAATTTLPVPETLMQGYAIVCKVSDLLAYAAIPLLIVNLGYSMSVTTKLTTLKDDATGAFLRVVLGPLLAFGVVICYRKLGWIPAGAGPDPLVTMGYRTTEAIIILNAAMPGPVMAYLLNVKFNNCPQKAASMVALGTLAGLITIPLTLHFINQFIAA